MGLERSNDADVHRDEFMVQALRAVSDANDIKAEHANSRPNSASMDDVRRALASTMNELVESFSQGREAAGVATVSERLARK